MSQWSERLIARALALQVFQRRHLVVVPNCNWTGHECDLLVVTENLRLIDVEVKISRADLKADASKEKWWHRPDNWRFTGATGGFAMYGPPEPDRRLAWPPKVWKHYYAMPKEIWKPELAEALPTDASGIILMTQREYHGGTLIETSVHRRATPNREAKPIEARDANNIARLASLRMWESYAEVEAMRARERAAAAA